MKNIEINFDFLKIQNPWWNGDDMKYDPVIDEFENQVIKYYSPEISKIKLNQDGIYGFFGARGMGKTTMLKLFIRELLTVKKIKRENVFYYSCHNIISFEQLNEFIKFFIRSRSEVFKNKEKLFIILDEISLVKNWENGIKHLISAGLLKNVVLIFAGSVLAIKEKQFSKQVVNVLKFNLSFKETISLLNAELTKKEIDMKRYQEIAHSLEFYLDIYLLTGGLISALGSYRKLGFVKQRIYNDYLSWQQNDVARMGRDIHLCQQILEQVIINFDKPVGHKTIAKKTKAKTHLTAGEYLKILDNMLATKTIFQSDETGEPLRASQKKIYFSNPFFFWTFYCHIHGSLNSWKYSRENLHKLDFYGYLINILIFNHLNRLSGVYDNECKVLFYRDSQNKKIIDFVVKKKSDTVAILNCFNKNITDKDIEFIKKTKFKKKIIISNQIMNLGQEIKIIPLTYFLLNYEKILQIK